MNVEVLMTIALIMFVRGDLTYRAGVALEEGRDYVLDKLTEAQKKLYDHFATHYEEITADFKAIIDFSLTDDLKESLAEILVPSAALNIKQHEEFAKLKQYLERNIRTTSANKDSLNAIKSIFASYYTDYKELHNPLSDKQLDGATYQVALLEFVVLQLTNKLIELADSTSDKDQALYTSVKQSLQAILDNFEDQSQEKTVFCRTAGRYAVVSAVKQKVEQLIKQCDQGQNALSLQKRLEDQDERLYNFNRTLANFLLRATDKEYLALLDEREISSEDLAQNSLGMRYWKGSVLDTWEYKGFKHKSPVNHFVYKYADYNQALQAVPIASSVEKYATAQCHQREFSAKAEQALKKNLPSIQKNLEVNPVGELSAKLLDSVYMARLLVNDLRVAVQRHGEYTLLTNGEVKYKIAVISELHAYIQDNFSTLLHSEYFTAFKQRLNTQNLKGLQVALSSPQDKTALARSNWGDNRVDGNKLPRASNIAVSQWWFNSLIGLQSLLEENDKLAKYLQEQEQENEAADFVKPDELTVYDYNLAIMLVHNPALIGKIVPVIEKFEQKKMQALLGQLFRLKSMFAACHPQKHLKQLSSGFDNLRHAGDLVCLQSELKGFQEKLVTDNRASEVITTATEHLNEMQTLLTEITEPKIAENADLVMNLEADQPLLGDQGLGDEIYAGEEVTRDQLRLVLFKHIYLALYDSGRGGWLKGSQWLRSPSEFFNLTINQLEEYCSSRPKTRSRTALNLTDALLNNSLTEEDQRHLANAEMSQLSEAMKVSIFNVVHRASYHSSFFNRTGYKPKDDYAAIKDYAQDKQHQRSHTIFKALKFNAQALVSRQQVLLQG